MEGQADRDRRVGGLRRRRTALRQTAGLLDRQAPAGADVRLLHRLRPRRQPLRPRASTRARRTPCASRSAAPPSSSTPNTTPASCRPLPRRNPPKPTGPDSPITARRRASRRHVHIATFEARRRGIGCGEQAADRSRRARRGSRSTCSHVQRETRQPASCKRCSRSAVALESGVGVVKATAIGFDDQPSIAPEEVGLADGDRRASSVTLTSGRGKPARCAQAQEHPLQLAASSLGLRVEFVDAAVAAGQPHAGHDCAGSVLAHRRRDRAIRSTSASAIAFLQFPHRTQLQRDRSRVRATVVQGIPSHARSDRHGAAIPSRCASIPPGIRPRRFGAVTSIDPAA